MTRTLLLAAGLASLAGCDARIDRFTASAHEVCPGQPVQLAWQVTGSATMKSQPPLASLPDGPVDSPGQATVAPTATTNIELHATRLLGQATSSTQELRVHAASSTPETIAVSLADPSSGCGEGKVWGTVHVQRFASQIEVGIVSAHGGDNRTYDVAHAGVHGAVSPGTTATELAGLAIAGDWVLTSPLRPGESCGTPTLPRSLTVDVFTRCAPRDP